MLKVLVFAAFTTVCTTAATADTLFDDAYADAQEYLADCTGAWFRWSRKRALDNFSEISSFMALRINPYKPTDIEQSIWATLAMLRCARLVYPDAEIADPI